MHKLSLRVHLKGSSSKETRSDKERQNLQAFDEERNQRNGPAENYGLSYHKYIGNLFIVDMIEVL